MNCAKPLHLICVSVCCYMQGRNGRYTGTYTAYILDFLNENRILSVYKERYSIYTLKYTLRLERTPSFFFTTTPLVTCKFKLKRSLN